MKSPALTKTQVNPAGLRELTGFVTPSSRGKDGHKRGPLVRSRPAIGSISARTPQRQALIREYMCTYISIYIYIYKRGMRNPTTEPSTLAVEEG